MPISFWSLFTDRTIISIPLSGDLTFDEKQEILEKRNEILSIKRKKNLSSFFLFIPIFKKNFSVIVKSLFKKS